MWICVCSCFLWCLLFRFFIPTLLFFKQIRRTIHYNHSKNHFFDTLIFYIPPWTGLFVEHVIFDTHYNYHTLYFWSQNWERHVGAARVCLFQSTTIPCVFMCFDLFPCALFLRFLLSIRINSAKHVRSPKWYYCFRSARILKIEMFSTIHAR